jgi:hypothetical protein
MPVVRGADMCDIWRHGVEQFGQGSKARTLPKLGGLPAATIMGIADRNQFGIGYPTNRVDVLAGDISTADHCGSQET